MVKYSMTTKPLCYVPYYGLELTARQTTLCCKMDRALAPKFTVDEFASPRLDQIRRDLFESSDQLPAVCNACSDAASIFTRRAVKHQEYQDLGWPAPKTARLRDLHIALDNVCASSCTMCNPNLSHSFAQLVKPLPNSRELYPRINFSQHPTQLHNLTSLEGQLADLEILHVFGGEPLISPQWPKLMTMMAQHAPKLKKITLNTGMKQIKPRWVEQLVNLDSSIDIELLISIDGPWDLNQWIRGCSQQEFYDAAELLLIHKPRFKQLSFQSVLAAFNIWAVPELFQTVQSIDPTIRLSVSTVWDPSTMSPWQLPSDLKALTQTKLEQYKTHPNGNFKAAINQSLKILNSQPSSQPWAKCLEDINRIPRLRGEGVDLDFFINQYLHK